MKTINQTSFVATQNHNLKKTHRTYEVQEKFKLEDFKNIQNEKEVKPQKPIEITVSEYIKTSINTVNHKVENPKSKINTRRQNIDDGSYCIYESDESGKDLRRLDYDASGKLYSTLEFQYNKDGTIQHTVKNASGTIVQITNVDEHGRVTHNSWFNDDGELTETAETSYTNNGIETTFSYDETGNLHNIYIYDTVNNKPVTQITYDKNGNLDQRKEYNYDEFGAHTENTYNAYGKTVSVANYHSDGRIQNTLYYGGTDEILERIDFFYNNNGQNISMTTDNNNDILSFRFYDTNGQVLLDINQGDIKTNDCEKLIDILEEYRNISDLNLISELDKNKQPIRNNYSNDAEFENAIKKWNENYEKVQNNIDKYTAEYNEISNKIDIVKTKYNSLMFDQQIKEAENKQKTKPKTAETNDLLTQIEEYQTAYYEKTNEKLMLLLQISEIFNNISNLKHPRPPQISECASDDEYKKLLNLYMKESQEFDIIKEVQEKNLETTFEKLANIDSELRNITEKVTNI